MVTWHYKQAQSRKFLFILSFMLSLLPGRINANWGCWPLWVSGPSDITWLTDPNDLSLHISLEFDPLPVRINANKSSWLSVAGELSDITWLTDPNDLRLSISLEFDPL